MPSSNVKKIPKIIGIVLLLGGLFVLVRLFFAPLSQEVIFLTKQTSSNETGDGLQPPNTDYAIVIPKIGAVAPVVQDVDPLDSAIYQFALTKGVAHAKGTANPGQNGNIFLFAHSSADLFTASKYNSIFYLVHHLNQGDRLKIWYRGEEYHYQVVTKEFVNSNATKYLTQKSSSEVLTLMTCWPPGTTYKRLIIVAKPLVL